MKTPFGISSAVFSFSKNYVEIHSLYFIIHNDMKTILAIDSFKGCMASAEIEAAVAEALNKKGVDALSLPMSDGGEGMLHAFTQAKGGRLESVYIHNQMMHRVDALYGIAPDGTAIIEVAQACGLGLVKPAERNPMRATTYGVGELLSRAIKNGCRNFIVGLGGTGTSDAGIGMIKALVDIFARGKNFDEALKTELGECHFTLASDVANPLVGEKGAARVFAPQKGATCSMVEQLERRAGLFAEKSALHFGYDKSKEPGAGAAGGLGYAFMQYLGGEMCSGAELLLNLCSFDEVAGDADLIITGEGCADSQTLMGKLPWRVLQRGNKLGVPVGLLAGSIENKEKLLAAGFSFAEAVTPLEMPLSEAMKKSVVSDNVSLWVSSFDFCNNIKGQVVLK